MICMVAIGLYFYFKTDDLNDYVLGGRGLGPGVTALSAGASDMSGWLLLVLLIIVSYTFLGGYNAVSWTDFVQGTLWGDDYWYGCSDCL